MLIAAGLLFSCNVDSSETPSAPPDDTSSTPPQKKIYWSEEVDTLLIETIGEEGLKMLPIFESDSYKARNSTDKSSLTNYTTIYCNSSEVSGSEARLYGVVLTASGFSSQDSGSNYLRYKELNDTQNLIVTFVQGTSASGYSLAMNVYVSNYRYTYWPEEVINHYTGLSNIPHLDGTYHYIQYNNDGSLYINIEGLASSCINEYTSLLEDNGYETTYYYTYSVVVYSAVSSDNSHNISYYYDADTSVLAMSITKN